MAVPGTIEDFRKLPALRKNWILFWSFAKITSLVIGGGYAIISAAQDDFVKRRKWLNDDDMLEMITVTQTVPGILACNAAIYIGWRINGFAGACSAMIGAILPSLVIIVLVAAGLSRVENVIESPYVQGAFKGIIGCIVGMVIVTALKTRKKAVKGLFGWCVAAGCFAGLTIFKIPPAQLIVLAIAAGLLRVGLARFFPHQETPE